MQKQRPSRDKSAKNAAYAGRYPRRKKKDRRKARKVRAMLRELRWLAQSGIERDHDVPLIAGQKREKGRYMP